MLPNPDRVRWVFFDFAGTLGFNDPPRIWNYVWTCARRGHFFDRRDVRPVMDEVWGGMDTEAGIAHPEASADEQTYDLLRARLEREILVRLGIPESGEREAMVQELLAVQDDPDTYTLYPEVPAALARMAEAGYRMCVVSNFNWALPQIAEGLGLTRYAEQAVTSARVGYRKPHPRIYEAALEATGADAAESLFVGDSFGPDYEGPMSLGFQALMVDRRASGRHRAPAIHRLTELPAVLTGPGLTL